MPVELYKLTTTQLEALSRERTVFFFPVGPLEDHGPHLPIGLDLQEAENLCFLSAQHLEAEMPGWIGVIMPKAPLGIESNTTRIAITVRAHVLRDWLVDSCRSLIRMGFYHFACFSGHLGPRQLTSIEEAGKLIGRARMGWFYSLIGSTRLRPTLISVSSSLTGPAQSMKSPVWPDPDEHGGERDTSVALAILGSRVISDYQGLPKVAQESSWWKRSFNFLFRKKDSYWGDPATASAESGNHYLLAIVDHAFPKMRAVWEGANPQFLFKSWYSIILFNRSFFKSWILVVLIGLLFLLWFYLNNFKFEV